MQKQNWKKSLAKCAEAWRWPKDTTSKADSEEEKMRLDATIRPVPDQGREEPIDPTEAQ